MQQFNRSTMTSKIVINIDSGENQDKSLGDQGRGCGPFGNQQNINMTINNCSECEKTFEGRCDELKGHEYKNENAQYAN